MGIYTSDQLKDKFRLSREQHQRERAREREEKQAHYKELCHQADLLLKKAEEDAKQQRMTQLYLLAEKTSQRRLKQPQTPPPIPNSDLIEDDPFRYITITTREQLKRIEEEDGVQYINWDVWDRVVAETKQKLKDLGFKLNDPPKDVPPPQVNRHRVRIYMYDLNDNLKGVFDDSRQCAKFLGVNKSIPSYYKHIGKPYLKLGLKFTDIPL